MVSGGVERNGMIYIIKTLVFVVSEQQVLRYTSTISKVTKKIIII